MIGDYLQRFEITTSYTSSFTNNDGLVRCDPEHIYYFKKFCDQINIDAVLPPYRYYLAHNQTGACQLEYYGYNESLGRPNNQLFKLFYLFPYNKTHDMIRVYNETVDFKNWNFLNDGEFVEFVDFFSSNINFQHGRKEPFWNTGLAIFGSQNESRVFTIIYPVLGDYDPSVKRENIIEKVDEVKNKTKEKNIKMNTKSCSKKYNQKSIKNDLNANYSKRMKSSKTNFIDKLNDLFLFYEKKIMNKLFCLNMSEISFARNIEEAKKKNHAKQKATINYQDRYVISNVGSSFFTESLYAILKQKKHDKYNHYIITDYMYNVLIEKDIGAVYPKYFDEEKMSIFPNISDINSSFWNSVEKDIIDVPIDVPLLVNASTSIQYMIIKRIINARSKYSFYLIMLIEINPKILEIYSLITNVFIICLVFLMIVFFVIKYTLFLVVSNRNKKLKNKPRAFAVRHYNHDEMKLTININPFKGRATEAIDKLRILQLMNSEDINLNDSVDNVIIEMTKNDDELFNIQIEDQLQIKDEQQSTICSFCSYLIDYEHDLKILKNKNNERLKKKAKENFKTNKILNFYLNNNKKNEKYKNEVNENIYLDYRSKDDQLFHIWNIKINSILKMKNDGLLNSNPHKYLIIKYMKFIQKQNLLLAEIYPDVLLSFILIFTDNNVFSYHCKIKSFLLMKMLVKHNFKFWLKSKTDIFILFLALILRNSRIKRADDIINYLISFVSYQNDYFTNLLRVLIDETNNAGKMVIFGELYKRIQSPNFSVPNNERDTVLFMKALLCFADFAPYLSEYEKNEKCFYEINKVLFTKEERENMTFISNFHFEMTKNVVFPWLNLMNSLSPKIEINNSVLENIDFWYQRTNNIESLV